MMEGPHCDAIPTNPGLLVTLPSGASISSTHKAKLTLPNLPDGARQCHLFPGLATGSLMSIGQLCDNGCQALFTATTVKITRNHQTVLTGTRTPATGLWMVTTDPSIHSDTVSSPTTGTTYRPENKLMDTGPILIPRTRSQRTTMHSENTQHTRQVLSKYQTTQNKYESLPTEYKMPPNEYKEAQYEYENTMMIHMCPHRNMIKH